jgi:hypothetical protein
MRILDYHSLLERVFKPLLSQLKHIIDPLTVILTTSPRPHKPRKIYTAERKYEITALDFC